MDFFKGQETLKQCIELYNSHGLKSIMVIKKLTPIDNIVEKEKKRLGIKHPKITMEEIGFEEVKSEDNLYNMAEKNKIKITKIESNTHNKIKIGLRSAVPTTVTMDAGTMLFPDEPLANNTQSLIVRDDVSTQVSDTESEMEISTFCFNKELRSPGRDTFYLGNIKSNRYKKGMNQGEVWEITTRQRKVLK